MQEILKADNLSLAYQGKQVLTGISFSIKSGDYVALAGPNGAGKTTLVKSLLGLIPLAEGKVTIFGQDLNSFKEWNKVAYLAQQRDQNPLFPASVREVVASAWMGLDKSKRVAIEKRADNLLEELGVGGLYSKLFSRLSGGQQQRVLLARALARQPELLFLDEPTTALDPLVREKFFRLLREANKQGTTIVMVTHDTADSGRYARLFMYLDRSLVFFGDFSDFCRSQKMGDYFGDAAQHIICHQHQH